MFIIPIAGYFDWRHPPLATLLLIVANTLVFLFTASGDEDAYDRAYAIYRDADLYVYEEELFTRHANDPAWLARWDLDAPPEGKAEQMQYILVDRSFDPVVTSALAEVSTRSGADRQEHAAWKNGRSRFLEALQASPSLSYGIIPRDSVALTFFTSMFLHGGVDHLFGNMLFLFLFGFALERVLGGGTFIATYLLTGIAGGITHILVNGESFVPTIGASGAVSGLMGAYLAVYQLRKIRFFYAVLFYFGSFTAPALAILPVWLAKELYGFYFGDVGIAYWVHIGGLIAGAAAGLALLYSGRVKDSAYLAESSANDERQMLLNDLDQALDEFQFDRARALAGPWLSSHPDDAEIWVKYAGLMQERVEDSAYEAYARGLFALARANVDPQYVPQLRESLHATYTAYMTRDGKKTALKDVETVAALGRRFLADGHVRSARQLAGAILRSSTTHPAAGQLIKALSSHFAQQGDNDIASEYMRAFREQFVEQEN